MNERMEAELSLLRLHYAQVEYVRNGGLHWYRVESVRTAEGWSSNMTPVAFSVTEGHPGPPPYGFYIPAGLTYAGSTPADHPAPYQPPFHGTWLFLSWQALDWQPDSDIASGSNLWAWVRSFVHRFEEGR